MRAGELEVKTEKVKIDLLAESARTKWYFAATALIVASGVPRQDVCLFFQAASERPAE
ncbi:MAG TPA: hypothetical protein VNM72_12380 [Blastocatellia bacterium]|nr:hypothetical protein [Blastocatellia bacterium]